MKLVEHTMAALPDHPIIIRLSGWTQLNDRLAMREVARQLTQQTGRAFLSDSDADELDADDNIDNPFIESNAPVSLPPPSHLPALISVLPTLSRPTIVVLDAFDLFALHARQSLLYCLLDTAQSCRAGNGNKGVAIVGITTRVDTINLLEKRVKSRFSGRTLRTAPPPELDNWLNAARTLLSSPIHSQHQEEWVPMWTASVDKFLTDHKVIKTFHETFALFKDARMLNQLIVWFFYFILRLPDLNAP
jgi:origin recognition complex subunit 4